MMNKDYYELSRAEDEQLIYQETVSVSLVISLICIGAVLLIASMYFSSLLILILSITVVAYSGALYMNSEYVISNKRVLSKTGFIKRHVVELKIHQVESVTLEQTILGRILNYGTLVFSGSGNPVVKMELIQNPIQFKSRCLDVSQMDKI